MKTGDKIFLGENALTLAKKESQEEITLFLDKKYITSFKAVEFVNNNAGACIILGIDSLEQIELAQKYIHCNRLFVSETLKAKEVKDLMDVVLC